MTSPAADRIWGLVSGFPERKRRGRLLLMLQAYFDGSGTGDKDGIFAMAGYIAPAEKWAEFSDEWQRLLDTNSTHYRKLEYFKMSEMDSSRDVERCGHFYSVIEKYVTSAVSCTVNVPQLIHTVETSEFAPHVVGFHKLKNPYYFAFMQIIRLMLNHKADLYIEGPVDFVFDEEQPKGEMIDLWDSMKNAWSQDYPQARDMLEDPPMFRNDKTTLPIQAADLYAYWIRKWELDGVGVINGIANFKFPWTVQRKKLRSVHRSYFEADFKGHLDDAFKVKVQNYLRDKAVSVSSSMDENGRPLV